MSYDLYLYRVPPDADPLDACRAAFEAAEDRAGAPGDSPRRMMQIAEALREENRNLEVKEGGVGGHAFVLLQSPQSGIQVWLFTTCASVDVPFRHAGARAAEVWREAGRYVEVLERESGVHAYDPQRDELLDPRTGLDEVLARYAGGVRLLEEIEEGPPRGERVSRREPRESD